MIKKIINLVSDRTREFWRFILVGFSGALVDYSIYLGLTRWFVWWQNNYLYANFLAIFLANANNFIWHYFWTFGKRSGSWFKAYIKFLLTSIIYLGLIQAGLWYFTKYWGWLDVVAKLFSNAVALIIYYLVVKKYIFSSIDSKNQSPSSF